MHLVKELNIESSTDIYQSLSYFKEIAALLEINEKKSQILIDVIEDISLLFIQNEKVSGVLIDTFLEFNSQSNHELVICVRTQGANLSKQPSSFGIAREILKRYSKKFFRHRYAFVDGNVEVVFGMQLARKTRLTPSLIKKCLQILNNSVADSKEFSDQMVEQLSRAYQEIYKQQDEVRSLNNELGQAILELKNKNEDLVDFTHVVAHDLKQPLNNLHGLFSLLDLNLEKNDLEKAKFLINTGLGQINYLRSFIQKVMDYAKAGADDIAYNKIDLIQYLNKIVNQNKSIKNLEIKLDIYKLYLFFPEPEFQVICNNLISNSIKYNDKKLKQIHIKQDSLVPFIISFTDN